VSKHHASRHPAALLLAAALALPAAAAADSLLGGLKDKAAAAADAIGDTAGAAADAVGKAAGTVVDRTKETLESTRDDLRDEASPAETRAKLNAMAAATLERLFAERPEARPLFDASAGYAVFDTRQVAWGLTAGYGRGVAVDRDTGQRTYMRVGSGGVGVGFGIGGFDTQLVLLFENAFAFHRFVVEGVDATAEAGTLAGEEQDQVAVQFHDGRAMFVLTQKGWKVSAKLAGNRYWPDAALNEDDGADR
jgi:lipid-binding SYLF domain-containing protein